MSTSLFIDGISIPISASAVSGTSNSNGDEEAAGGIGSDGEGINAILQAADRSRRRRRAELSRREEARRGEPGSRRFRRFLNSTLSDYDSEVDVSDLEAPDHSIVHFEWDSKFIAAGDKFFTEPTMQGMKREENARERMKNGMSRTQRRLMRMMKNRQQGKYDKQGYKVGRKESDESEDDEEDEEDEMQEFEGAKGEKRLGKKKGKAKTPTKRMEIIAQTTSPSSNGSSSPSFNTAPGGPAFPIFSTSSSSASSAIVSLPSGSSSAPSSAPTLFIPTHSDFAEECWRSLDRGVRSIFRKMYDFTFLHQLESLLIAYKKKKINAIQAASRKYKGQFVCKAPNGREKEAEDLGKKRGDRRAAAVQQRKKEGGGELEEKKSNKLGEESELDGEEWIVTDTEEVTSNTASASSASSSSSSSSSSSHPASSAAASSDSDLPLDLLFEDSFHRLLAHAVIHFHQLKSSSYTSSAGYRHTVVKRHKQTILHRAKLERYIVENFSETNGNVQQQQNQAHRAVAVTRRSM